MRKFSNENVTVTFNLEKKVHGGYQFDTELEPNQFKEFNASPPRAAEEPGGGGRLSGGEFGGSIANTMKLTPKRAVSQIEKHGILLVFPLANRAEPASLWSSFFPRSAMKWEWDSGGDNRVASLWHLREELSRGGDVVYAKWFRGRATFFSKELFVAALAHLWFQGPHLGSTLSLTAKQILSALELNSPLSTKELKAETDLKGKDNEPAYHRALKELWDRLLIVGYGEKDDGAFPSLRVGATATLFESLWNQAVLLNEKTADQLLRAKLGNENIFYQQLMKRRGKVLV